MRVIACDGRILCCDCSAFFLCMVADMFLSPLYRHLFLPEGIVQWHLILKRKKSKMDVLRVLAFAIYNAIKLLIYKCTRRQRARNQQNDNSSTADSKPKESLDAHNIDYFSSVTRHGELEELSSDSEYTSSGTSEGTSEGTSDSDSESGERRPRRPRRKTKFASGAPGAIFGHYFLHCFWLSSVLKERM